MSERDEKKPPRRPKPVYPTGGRDPAPRPPEPPPLPDFDEDLPPPIIRPRPGKT